MRREGRRECEGGGERKGERERDWKRVMRGREIERGGGGRKREKIGCYILTSC